MATITPRWLLRQFPHMFPKDIAIWRRFLVKFADQYQRFEYDVKVGEGRSAPEDTTEDMRQAWDILTRKRIDAVGHKSDQTEIIEVKPQASSSAIGQVITYMHLYEESYKPDKPLKGVIVTDRLEPDTQKLCEKLGFDLHIV